MQFNEFENNTINCEKKLNQLNWFDIDETKKANMNSNNDKMTIEMT